MTATATKIDVDGEVWTLEWREPGAFAAEVVTTRMLGTKTEPYCTWMRATPSGRGTMCALDGRRFRTEDGALDAARAYAATLT